MSAFLGLILMRFINPITRKRGSIVSSKDVWSKKFRNFSEKVIEAFAGKDYFGVEEARHTIGTTWRTAKKYMDFMVCNRLLTESEGCYKVLLPQGRSSFLRTNYGTKGKEYVMVSKTSDVVVTLFSCFISSTI